ncbi:MAG: hypothetical protein BWY31_02674 [Lentisphaerae bacterium ADurb.Bin242]|nr:MAG: hypothetical protein BWY31_02674 [Lentisphaerae bacterium ADurb.Bin242]
MKFQLITVVGMLAVNLFSAEYSPVHAEVKKGNIYRQETFSIVQTAVVSNQFNTCRLTLALSKPGTWNLPEPYMKFLFDAGKFGFGSLVDFFTLKVNGIEMNKLSPRPESLTRWEEKELAGAELKLNYNGAKVVFRFFMRPDSPLLFASVFPAGDTLEPVRTAQAVFTAIPSSYILKNGQVVWRNGDYQRMAVTPVRTIRQTAEPVPLTPADTRLILMDAALDGSSDEKGYGPCALFLDYRGIERAVLSIGNAWVSKVTLDFTPGWKEFRFAIWQPSARISNADCIKRLSSEKF